MITSTMHMHNDFFLFSVDQNNVPHILFGIVGFVVDTLLALLVSDCIGEWHPNCGQMCIPKDNAATVITAPE